MDSDGLLSVDRQCFGWEVLEINKRGEGGWNKDVLGEKCLKN